jgi:hypothetical protein
VTWDGSERRSSGKQEQEKKRKHGVFIFCGRRIGSVGSTCNRKPQILF